MTRMVPVAALVHHPDNPPMRARDVDELADSIAAQGVLQPLLIEPFGDRRFVVIDGNRRLAGARRAGLTAVPAMLRAATDRQKHLLDRLIANGHRLGLTPMEQARGFGDMLRAGLTQADIARATGFSGGHVSTRLALLDLDDKTQQLVEVGALPADDALTAVRAVRGNSTGRKKPTPSHFGPAHRLAETARARCRATHARPAGKLGGVACGPCWEHAIVDDAQLLGDVAS
jgi:ParB/RepB/Spo0J family partition protein